MGLRPEGSHTKNEQDALVEAMETLFARVCRYRDVVYGDRWDEDMPRAWQDLREAVDRCEAAQDGLA